MGALNELSKKIIMDNMVEAYEDDKFQADNSQAVIDYNVMMGVLDDPTIEENEEA